VKVIVFRHPFLQLLSCYLVVFRFLGLGSAVALSPFLSFLPALLCLRWPPAIASQDYRLAYAQQDALQLVVQPARQGLHARTHARTTTTTTTTTTTSSSRTSRAGGDGHRHTKAWRGVTQAVMAVRPS
jgi:hypothetical protein